MATTNKSLYDSLDELRQDLKNRAVNDAAGLNLNSDLNSEALLNDLYGEMNAANDYDVTTDPAYSSMKKAAYREADRTMRDTLAQGNTKSNGFTNSAAITAASQARDYTMSQFDDKVAALEDRALSKQNAKINAKMQLFSAVEGMEASKRQNYLQELQLLEAAAEQERQNALEDMDRQEKAKDKEMSIAEAEAQNIISMGGIPSDELMAKAGWSTEYAKAVKQNAYNNMDVASMQQYLRNQGQNISVDGVWGPATEAAYQKVFGTSSGRQNYYGSSGGGSGYSSSSSSNTTKQSDNTQQKSKGSFKQSELQQCAAAGMSKSQIEAALRERGVNTSSAGVQLSIDTAIKDAKKGRK